MCIWTGMNSQQLTWKEVHLRHLYEVLTLFVQQKNFQTDISNILRKFYMKTVATQKTVIKQVLQQISKQHEKQQIVLTIVIIISITAMYLS